MTPTAITQTRDGYLWVGTYNGLARFDGVQFSTFTINNTAQLVSDHILALHEDGWGMLWIGTAEGGMVTYHEEFRRETDRRLAVRQRAGRR